MSDNAPLLDPTTVTPEQFAKIVKETPRERLAELMSNPELRNAVLDEVFNRMGDHYKPGSASGVIHWKIIDKPGGGHDLYETVLDEQTCTVNKEPTHKPRVTISLAAPELLKLASGNGSPTMMFFSGKLKVSGDFGFAAGLASMFNLPQA